MDLRGFDISSWNHPNDDRIDFASAKSAGYDFVMIKATQGTTYRNPFLAEDHLEARAAGLLVGLYHYAVPGAGDAEAQAQFAVAAASGLHLDLGIALDLEETGTLQMFELSAWAQPFLAEINRLGHQAPYYTNGSYLTQVVGSPWGHKLWYASSELPTSYVGPAPWMRQDPKAGTVPGVPGKCDLDTLISARGLIPASTTATARAHVDAPDLSDLTGPTDTETTSEPVSGLGDASGEPSSPEAEPASSTVATAGSEAT